MSHDWILDVLADLQQYARMNGLAAIAAKADETMKVAQQELSDGQGPGGVPPQGLPGTGQKAH